MRDDMGRYYLQLAIERKTFIRVIRVALLVSIILNPKIIM